MPEWSKCIIFTVLLVALTFIATATDSKYVKANRYSSCMEGLLERSDKNDTITFEQMESVCKHYLD